MLQITLNRYDSIETLLPVVESAMESGDVCQINNIHYLGMTHLAALKMLVLAGNLFDAESGKVCRVNPGFRLVGVDEYGASRILT
jgi:hypothetical protein